MTEGNNPFDTDLSTIDTGFPLLVGEIYEMRIAKIDVKDNEAETAQFELTTTAPAKSVDGDQLEVGTKVFATTNLKATGKATQSMIAKRLGEIIQATGATGFTVSNFKERRGDLIGQTVRVRVGVKPAGNDKKGVYRKARNEVTEWLRK
jgi:hypothetical protein